MTKTKEEIQEEIDALKIMKAMLPLLIFEAKQTEANDRLRHLLQSHTLFSL